MSPGRQAGWARRPGGRATWLAQVVVVFGLVGWVAVGLCSATAVAAAPRRVGGAPRLPRDARAVGALASSTRIPVLVALRARDPAALAGYAAAVSEPGSSVYHRF
jgi:hypothetical protein